MNIVFGCIGLAVGAIYWTAFFLAFSLIGG